MSASCEPLIWPLSAMAMFLTQAIPPKCLTLIRRFTVCFLPSRHAADSVHSLKLRQLPSHMDPEVLLSRFPHLERLSLTYGAHGQGMRVDRAAIGMTHKDADSLAHWVRSAKALRHLR